MKRVHILGLGSNVAAVAAALALAEAGMAVERAEAVPMQEPPPPKDRSLRGPALNAPEPWGSGGRQRAQWKDERQRRGRQR